MLPRRARRMDANLIRATGMLGASLTEARIGKALSDRPALEPYWGKPAVRNLRGDRGNVGIIRSPVRASILPDFLSIPPSLSVSRAVQYLKGRSSHKLLAEFASLRKRYWGQHLWARGYWVTSSGNVIDEVWMEYINSQTAPEPDDDFRVT